MFVDLALVDVAAFGFEDVFNRVFEGENVVLAVAVDEIDEGGEGGGLAGTDGTGDQHEAVLIAGERKDVLERQADVFDRLDLVVDDPEGHVVAEALFDDGSAVASVRRGVGKVNISLFFEPFPFLRTEEGPGEALGVFGSERIVVGPNRRKLAKTSPCRRVGRREVEIRAIVIAAELEVLIDVIEDLMCRHGWVLFIEG